MNVDIETNVFLLESYGQKVLAKSFELLQNEQVQDRWKNIKLLMDLADKIEKRLATLITNNEPINFQRIIIDKEKDAELLKKYGFELLKRIRFFQSGPINESRTSDVKTSNETLTSVLGRINIIETRPDLLVEERTTNENLDVVGEATNFINKFDEIIGRVQDFAVKAKNFDNVINEHLKKEQEAKEREDLLVAEINKRDQTIEKLKSIIISVQNLSSEVTQEEQVSRKAA